MTATSKHQLSVRFTDVLLISLLVLVLQVQGFSRGSPDGACSTLTPGHTASAKTSASPFGLAAEKVEVAPGETVDVAIGALPGNPGLFKGYLIQARDKNNPDQIVGIFQQPIDKSGNLLNCGQGIQNAVTHANSARKQRVVLKWQAPADFEGEVLFRATFVEDYSSFWTNVQSEPVRVARAAAEPPKPSTTTTTTTSTTTTTTTTRPAPVVRSEVPAWSFSTTSPPSPVTKFHKIYEGCSEIKGCFGIPTGCIVDGSCTAVASYSVKGDRYEFELRGLVDNQNTGGYVAIGFSKDRSMGDDSVTECIYRLGQAQPIAVYNSKNVGRSNARLTSQAGLTLLSQSFEDGHMYCRFERDQVIPIDGYNWDLKNKHHILVARGAASGDGVSFHIQKKASDEAVDIASVSAVAAKSDILIQIHGAFMVAAWIWAASCGILIARYFKQTWVGSQIMGKDLWFVFHRLLMVTAWLLTIAGFIIIFVEIGGWTALPININPHPVLGCITTGLAFIQPFMAHFRPHPGTSKRWIFNWAHWFVGNAAHMLGVATIFLAVELPKAGLAGSEGVMYWLLGAYVAFHVTMHLIFSVHQMCQENQDRSKDFALKDFGNQNGVTPFTVDRKVDAPGSMLRKLLVTLYFLVISGISAALIAMIALGPSLQNRVSKA